MPRPKSGERQPGCYAGRRVHGELFDPHAGGEHVLDDADLPMELQRPCLDGQRTRGFAWTGRLVEDADRHAESRQPERERQPGRPGTGNEDLGL